MIEPVERLALSLHTNPGAYCVVLGSGVSRDAGIPTGWEVVIDLCRKLAVVRGNAIPDDPVAWYRKEFESDPDYSQLLDALGSTPAERLMLLRGHFEATSADRESGLKQPTRAHRALARLVADGYVHLVITTNFDRLLEGALEEVDIRPTVISSGDDLAGALPLAQARVLILKVHGDYLDSRLRNTPDELAELDQPISEYLEHNLPDHGLIVCGWSADWDAGLRDVMARSVGSLFGAYWTTRSEPNASARNLIEQLRATVVRIRDADAFFESLRENLSSLRDLATAGPLSASLAVATVKRYLPRADDQIRLHDLLFEELERVRTEVGKAGASIDGRVTYESLKEHLERLEEAAGTFVRMFATIAYWADDNQTAMLVRALARVARWPIASGNSFLLDARRYPAILALYAGGTAAIASGNYPVLARLLRADIRTERETASAARMLSASTLDHDVMNGVENVGVARRQDLYTPASNRVARVTRSRLLTLISEEEEFNEHFDRFEYPAVSPLCPRSARRRLLGPDWPVWMARPSHHGGRRRTCQS